MALNLHLKMEAIDNEFLINYKWDDYSWITPQRNFFGAIPLLLHAAETSLWIASIFK